jgi:hypothetical protein
LVGLRAGVCEIERLNQIAAQAASAAASALRKARFTAGSALPAPARGLDFD